MHRYDKPFEVMENVRAVAFRLKLSELLKLHSLFNVSYLKSFSEYLERSR